MINGAKQHKPVSAIRSGLKLSISAKCPNYWKRDYNTTTNTIRLSDVKNVNGVYVGSARGGAQESFWSRGYDMSAK
jgi:iron complex outermembrane receptor protein